jgi:hypothetical protein
MRTVLFALVGTTVLLLGTSAGAAPCKEPESHKGYCYCEPPMTKVCGPVWNEYMQQNRTKCWCHDPATDSGGYYGSGGGKAEIHKKNVPQTHPTPTPDMYWRGGPRYRVAPNYRVAPAYRMVRRPAPGVFHMQRW